MSKARISPKIAIALGMLALAACHSPDVSELKTRHDARPADSVTRKYGVLVYRGLDAFHVAPDGQRQVAADNTGRFGRSWTKATNLGLDLLTQVVAERVSLANETTTAAGIAEVLHALEGLRKFHGLFPEFIKLEGEPQAEIKAGAIRYSTIDSAWATVALSVVEARYRRDSPKLAQRARSLIEAQEYSLFVTENRLSEGVSVDAISGKVATEARFSYGDRNSEARPLVLALIGLGLLPEKVWDSMAYTWTERAGMALASSYATSAFVELTGQLFFDEVTLAPGSLGLSHRNYVEASASIARSKGHTIWGYAPSCAPPDGYAEFGLDRPDVVTPYAAAALATTGAPVAVQNLSRVLQALDWQSGPVADALDPVTRRPLCNDSRMLDQSLLFLALHVQALRDLARATRWYAPAEARLRKMDGSHLPPPESTRVAVDSPTKLGGG